MNYLDFMHSKLFGYKLFLLLFILILFYASAPASTIHSCLLGNPNSSEWVGRPSGIAGQYFTDGRIIFNQRPVQEWEFMATGTGMIGITVRFPYDMLVQINHADSFDEMGLLRTLGRLHISLDGDPFVHAQKFNMEHDLKRSVIKVLVETKQGMIRIEIRAHSDLDVIRFDIYDERTSLSALTCFLEKDYPHQEKLLSGGTYLSWHENLSSVYRNINTQCGFDMGNDAADPFLKRIFGTGIIFLNNSNKALWSAGFLNIPASKHHTFYVAGASVLNGIPAFEEAINSRFEKVAKMQEEEFIRSHESWWQTFWQNSCFEPEDSDGRFVRYKAAFDLYRYYLACASSDQREVPLRFQIDLFRFNLIQHPWSTMVINSIETYQAFFGAVRTGDIRALRSLFNFYKNHIEVFQKHSLARYGHDGLIIPYEHNIWGSYLFWNGEVLEGYTEAKSPYLKDTWAGNLWILLLMCDYIELSGDTAFVRETLFPLAKGIITFFQSHYPERENGKIVFLPSKAGETWQGVKNALELVSAFKILLPRLLIIGERHGFNTDTLQIWREMLGTIPEIPQGQLKYNPDQPYNKPEILPGNLLVPAEDMSQCEGYSFPWTNGNKIYSINRQHTELYAIWPSRLFTRESSKLQIARASYNVRLWQHINTGWALDVVHAACLGLQDEVMQWFDRHFEYTFTFPCGLAREDAPNHPECSSIPVYPSMQGMGTGVIPVFEMLIHDYPDKVVLLPCWLENVPVRFAFFSPFAGKVEVNYQPHKYVKVKTEHKINIDIGETFKGKIDLIVEENGK